MSLSDDTSTPSKSAAGITAEHAPLEPSPVLVAPAMEERFNTVRPTLSPIACWSIGDARFRFGSSFVRPEIAEDVMSLAALVQSLEDKLGKRPVASVFGHADPVGNDSFNKGLSGRRAAAIYGLLTQRTDIWEDIFSQKGKYASSLSADDWGDEAVETMLDDLGYEEPDDYDPGDLEEPKPENPEAEQDPVTAFQHDHGLAEDGKAGPKTREKLFGAYMEKHCRTRKGEPFKLEAGDFLARGEDAAGKGDYQGCSEFNPLMVFSEEEYKELSKSDKKGERNAANEPNRRVTVFLFDPKGRVSPGDWPCPRAKEGTSACRKRLWSDAEDRRRHGEETRLFEDSGKTFTCRFYERLAAGSPCERGDRFARIRIRLFDRGAQAIPFAPYRISIGNHASPVERADADGYANITAHSVPEECFVEWGPAPEEGSSVRAAGLPFRLRVYLDTEGSMEEDSKVSCHLHNLGYPVDHNRSIRDQQEVVAMFQKQQDSDDTDEKADGELSPEVCDRIHKVHDTCSPAPRTLSQTDDD